VTEIAATAHFALQSRSVKALPGEIVAELFPSVYIYRYVRKCARDTHISGYGDRGPARDAKETDRTADATAGI
jgi:hypothetical protein